MGLFQLGSSCVFLRTVSGSLNGKDGPLNVDGGGTPNPVLIKLNSFWRDINEEGDPDDDDDKGILSVD